MPDGTLISQYLKCTEIGNRSAMDFAVTEIVLFACTFSKNNYFICVANNIQP